MDKQQLLLREILENTDIEFAKKPYNVQASPSGVDEFYEVHSDQFGFSYNRGANSLAVEVYAFALQQAQPGLKIEEIVENVEKTLQQASYRVEVEDNVVYGFKKPQKEELENEVLKTYEAISALYK